MSIQGVIFDMDGVLCDSERFICEAACRMFRESHGTKVREEDFLPFVGAGENRYLGGVAEKYGLKLRMPEDKDRTYQIYLDMIKGRLNPLPGVREFIAECRQRGLKIAVASSADWVKVEGNLREIALPATTFDAVVCGNDVERKKPDPQIFLLAASRIGITPEKCLVVEDATNGITAGKAAGARCLGLTTSFDESTLRAAGADWIANNLAHAPPQIWH
jgi:HAD superfamily hydrolase (TIGR01509 family)